VPEDPDTHVHFSTTAVPDAKAYISVPISAKNDCEVLHNAIFGSVGSHFATEGISP